MTVFILKYGPVGGILPHKMKWDIGTIYHEGKVYHWNEGNVDFETPSGEPVPPKVLDMCLEVKYWGYVDCEHHQQNG